MNISKLSFIAVAAIVASAPAFAQSAGKPGAGTSTESMAGHGASDGPRSGTMTSGGGSMMKSGGSSSTTGNAKGGTGEALGAGK